MLAAGDAGRQVRENEIVPAVMRYQSVSGCQCDALLPFFRRNEIADAGRGFRLCHARHVARCHILAPMFSKDRGSIRRRPD